MQLPSLPNSNFRLILASGSIYRKALLSRLCLPFDVVVPDVDESARPGETPAAMAMRLAFEKADHVARNAPNSLVIGSDQVASLDGQAIGKPGSHENAVLQLQKMRARTVIFYTAVCVIDSRKNEDEQGPMKQQAQQAIVETVVKFRDLADEALDAYLHIEKPYDCAGSAKNEGLGIALIESCQSADPTALTGLPLIALCTMLHQSRVTFFTTEAS